ncbi:MAG: preprotein translocase subunit YajC [Sedimentisphaerales bacterium]|nr:preprotein translocase subunit YajC [Sedimentisphaerales bacterium]
MNDFYVLAQAETGEQAPPATQQTTGQEDPGTNGNGQSPAPSFFSSPILLIVMMIFVFYFVMMRPQKKKQQEHKNMLDSLKKNDRIRTIGGIIGTIVDVRDDEVVVKVDESNNTKMHFIRSAIGTVLTEENKDKSGS